MKKPAANIDLTPQNRYHPGPMKCKVCGHGLNIRGRSSESLQDSRVKITRYVKCRGPANHVYEQVEIHSPAAPQSPECYSTKARHLANMDRVGRYEGLISSDYADLDPFRPNRDRPGRSTPDAGGNETIIETVTPEAKEEGQQQNSSDQRKQIPRVPNQYQRDPFEIEFNF